MRIDHCREGVKVPSRYSLFIGTPTYSGELSCHYTASLLRLCEQLTKKQIPHMVYFSVFDSLVARARNDLVDNFLKSDCTHILMCDSDQGFEQDKVFDMLDLDLDFLTGAVVGRKPDSEEYAIKINVNSDMTPVVNQQGLISCTMNGVAFALIKREVFGKIATEKPYPHDVYPYFQHIYTEHGDHYGEDTWFVNTWLKSGGEVWIYPNITFNHGGKVGNYHEFLLKQPQPNQPVVQKEKTIEDIIKEASEKREELAKEQILNFTPGSGVK